MTSSAQALVTDIYVNTLADEMNADGDCSVREACRAWNRLGNSDACATVPSGNTARAHLPTGTITLSITNAAGSNENQCATGDLDLPPIGVEIVGQGEGVSILDGGGVDRVLHAVGGNTGCVHSLHDFTLTGGCSNAHAGSNCETAVSGGIASGGDFYDNSLCDLQEENLEIKNGHAASGGGQAICATGKGNVTLVNVHAHDNLAIDGGGFYAHVNWTIDDSVIEDNTAQRGGGVSQYNAEAILLDTTVDENVATASVAGGLWARGAVGAVSGTITMQGGALTNNRANASGGGAYAGDQASWETYCASAADACRVTLNGVEVTGNTSDSPTSAPSGSGGGIAQGQGGVVEVSGSSAVGSNTDSTSPYGHDCSGTIELYSPATIANQSGCTVHSHGPVCGNGSVETGEDCESGTCCNMATCLFKASGTSCSDGDSCTPADTCDGAGVCVAGGTTCGDGIVQTECGEVALEQCGS